MARQYSIFPKPLLMVVLFVVGYLGGGSSLDQCGDKVPTYPAYFPGYVDTLLHDLVANTPAHTADPSTGETKLTLIRPEGYGTGSGAATGTATCSRGYSGDYCRDCLKAAQTYLSPCRDFTAGWGNNNGMCSLDFYQL